MKKSALGAYLLGASLEALGKEGADALPHAKQMAVEALNQHPGRYKVVARYYCVFHGDCGAEPVCWQCP